MAMDIGGGADMGRVEMDRPTTVHGMYMYMYM